MSMRNSLRIHFTKSLSRPTGVRKTLSFQGCHRHDLDVARVHLELQRHLCLLLLLSSTTLYHVCDSFQKRPRQPSIARDLEFHHWLLPKSSRFSPARCKVNDSSASCYTEARTHALNKSAASASSLVSASSSIKASANDGHVGGAALVVDSSRSTRFRHEVKQSPAVDNADG